MPLRAARLLALLGALLGASRPTLGAAPSVELVPARVKPGDVVLVVVRGTGDALPEGVLGARALRFYRSGDHAEALTGIPIEESPGLVEARVRAGTESLRAPLEVVPPEFPERKLTVASRFVKVPAAARARIKADQAAFNRVWTLPLRPRAFSDNFAKPRDSDITAHFGDRRTLNGTKTTQHYGLDLDGATGDEVFAANAGRVVMVRDCYTSGNTVLVEHGAGLVTAYFHLSRFDVKPGQEVRRGQRLGLVGKTGRVTGPHLHFGAHVEGLWVNPQAVLALPFPGATSAPSVFLTPEPADAGTPADAPATPGRDAGARGEPGRDGGRP